MYKKSEAKFNEIKRLYDEGVLLAEICKRTSSSQPTVKKVLSFFDIDYSKIKNQEYQNRLLKVIELYKQGKSQKFMEKELKLTRKTIRILLKESGLEYRNMSDQQHIRCKTELDHNCFDELTPESLYWIGMLYTDGHIEVKREPSIELNLHSDDREHLEKFRLFLKTNRNISKGHDCLRVRVNSTRIRNRLMELGFTQNKSCTIYPHELLKQSRDFWRGCVDGDGGIYLKNKSYPCNTITLCGTLETIFDFIIFCSKYANIKEKYPSLCKGKNLYQVHYYGQDALKVADLLYKDSIIYMERKYEIYKQILELNNNK